VEEIWWNKNRKDYGHRIVLRNTDENGTQISKFNLINFVSFGPGGNTDTKPSTLTPIDGFNLKQYGSSAKMFYTLGED